MSEVYNLDTALMTGQTARIRIIPHWIYRAAIVNRLNTIELTDYTKAAQFLSQDDMAQWLYLNEKAQFGTLKVTDLCYLSLNEQTDKQALVNIKKTMQLYSTDESMAENLMHRFMYTQASTINDEYRDKTKTYQFIQTPTHILLILNEGFFDEMKSFDFELDFIRNCLKELYKVGTSYSINNSYTSLFKKYVKSLTLT